MEEDEFNHRRRKKGNARERVSMDEFIRRKREAENIKVETDKPNTPEVEEPEHPVPAEPTIPEESGNERPVSEESFPDLPLDSRQYMSETPPPLPMNRRESKPVNRRTSTFGQPADRDHPRPDLGTPRQNIDQRRKSQFVPRRESADQSRQNNNNRRQSYAVPRQNYEPVRKSNNRKSVMSDVQSVKSDRKSVMTEDRKSVVENDWQDGKTLAECNQYMFVNEIGSDVTFLLGPNEELVAAHSYVLMSRSAILSQLLSPQAKHPNKVLAIPDVNPESFRNLLRYIYTNELELTVPSAIALLPTCVKYGNKSIKQMCFKYLLSEMCSENVCDILELAHEFDEPTVHNKCLHFIHVNATDTLTAHGFRNLCSECVEKIVDSDELYADEMAVFNGLVTWANAECSRRKLQANDKTRREVLGNLLYSVRYSTMGVHDFTHKLSQNKMISAEEKIVLYQYFHGKIQSLPPNLQKGNRRQRAVRPEYATKFNQRSLSSPYDSTEHTQSPTNGIHRNKEQLRVLRFRGIAGTWRNKVPDAIAFRCSESIGLLGIQIFGPTEGSDVYDLNVTVFDDARTVVRNQDYTITTEASKVCDVILKDPILVPAWKTFTVQTTIQGAPSTRGIDGVKVVETEGVEFEFMASCKSLNGTDESVGQIPSLLFTKL